MGGWMGRGIFAQIKLEAVRVTLRGSSPSTRHPDCTASAATHRQVGRKWGPATPRHSPGVTVHDGMVRYVSGARSVLLLPTHPSPHWHIFHIHTHIVGGWVGCGTQNADRDATSSFMIPFQDCLLMFCCCSLVFAGGGKG